MVKQNLRLALGGATDVAAILAQPVALTAPEAKAAGAGGDAPARGANLLGGPLHNAREALEVFGIDFDRAHVMLPELSSESRSGVGQPPARRHGEGSDLFRPLVIWFMEKRVSVTQRGGGLAVQELPGPVGAALHHEP